VEDKNVRKVKSSETKSINGYPIHQITEELHRMPRYQWDDYLWKFCEEFVAREGWCPGTRDISGGRSPASTREG
jgi:hypothetical protein